MDPELALLEKTPHEILLEDIKKSDIQVLKANTLYFEDKI